MKKLLQLTFTLLALTVILQACSSSKSTTTSGTDVSHGRLVGNWLLTDVSYDGILQSAVQNVFNQAPPAAFINSTWNLPNSGNGVYTLASGTSQTIYWSYNAADKSHPLFQFKKIYQGDKAKDVTEGYQLEIVQADGATMTLRSPIAMGNKTAYVVYAFRKQ